MSQTPDDIEAREILEHWRQMGRIIDENTIKLAYQVVREHEKRMHPASNGEGADPDEKLSDELIESIMNQASREGQPDHYVCELRGISYSRFRIDYADYQRRFSENERKARYGW